MLFEQRLIAAIETLAPSIKFILADRNGVEPAAPYCLVSILNKSKIGKSSKNFTTTTKTETTQQAVQIVYRLTLHALATDIAQDTFETFHEDLESDNATFKLYEQGLGIQSLSEITYTSAPVDTTIYKRATFDITTLSNRINDTYVDEITDVSVTGTVTDKDNITETIEVNVKYG